MSEHPANRVPPPVEEPEPRSPETKAAEKPPARKRRGLFAGSLSRVLKSLKREPSGEELRDTLEEIIESADHVRDALAPDERRLLGNILRLHAVTAADVMVPRADIVAVEIETPLARLIDLVKREYHSRFPVYRGALDEIVGMIHVKDLIAHWSQRRGFAMDKVLRGMGSTPLGGGAGGGGSGSGTGTGGTGSGNRPGGNGNGNPGGKP